MSRRNVPSAYLGWLSTTMVPGSARCPSQAPCATQNLVLGAATGYDVADIAPFVLSLRSVYSGPAALVVDDCTEMAAFLHAHDVEAIVARPSAAWSPHAVMSRFALFDQVLNGRHDAGNILLTDVRDVVFQAHPFDPEPTALELFVEFDDGRLVDHAFNRKHLRALVGDDLAAAVADRPCLCVGTVMGSREGVRRFCRTILMLAAIPRSHVGGAFGADQAACNLAAHLGLVEHVVRENYGRVSTIGLTDPRSLTVRDGAIVNPDGSISAVVHQYDRHPHLMDAVHARWGGDRQRRERVRPATLDTRAGKLRNSVLRRLPELR